MNCDTARRLIDAYMDSELDSLKAFEVETHLSDCVGCRNLLESRQALSKAIKQAAAYTPAPDSLRMMLRRETRRKPRFRFGLVSTGLAFAVGVAVVLGVWRPWDSLQVRQERILHDLVTHYRRSVTDSRAVDISSSDPKKVQTWFTGRIDFSPKVPAMSDKRFALIGGRLDLIAGHTVPVLAYACGSHEADLFVTTTGEEELTSVDRNGLHVISWNDCGMNYWMVSDDSIGDLIDLRQVFWGRRDH